MHEVARNLAAFHQNKSKPGRMELVNPLVSTPVRGFTGIYIYMYICMYFISVNTYVYVYVYIYIYTCFCMYKDVSS